MLSTLTMKSSLERISTTNTKRLELLETKLRAIDLFHTYESNCRPNRDLVSKGKNTILNKECIFYKKNKYKKTVLEKLMSCLKFRAVDSIKPQH